MSKVLRPDETADGFVIVDGQMTASQRTALKRALAGGDATATVVVPARNFSDVAGTPNRLLGAYINEEGDAT